MGEMFYLGPSRRGILVYAETVRVSLEKPYCTGHPLSKTQSHAHQQAVTLAFFHIQPRLVFYTTKFPSTTKDPLRRLRRLRLSVFGYPTHVPLLSTRQTTLLTLET